MLDELYLKREKANFTNKENGQTYDYNRYYVEMINPVNGKIIKCYLKPTCEYDKRLLKDYYAG